MAKVLPLVAVCGVVTPLAAGVTAPRPTPPRPAPAFGLWSHEFVETPRGRIVAVAFSRMPAGVGVVRYLPSGRVDRSFRKVVLRDFGAGKLDALAAGVDRAGRIVVAACPPPDCRGPLVVGRLLANGSLDATFRDAGTTRTGVAGASLEPRALAIAPRTITVAGEASAGSARMLFIARYLADGGRDLRFGRNGLIVDELLGPAGAVHVDGRGRIVAAGDGYVARYDARGARDATFGARGVAAVPNLLAPHALAVDTAHRIVAAGSAQPRRRPALGIVRLLPDGRRDMRFGRAGFVRDHRNGDHWGRIEALVPLRTGVLAVGWATRGAAVPTRRYRSVALRLDERGRAARGFGVRGRVTFGGFEAQARAAFRRDGTVLVVGPDDDLRPTTVRFARLRLR